MDHVELITCGWMDHNEPESMMTSILRMCTHGSFWARWHSKMDGWIILVKCTDGSFWTRTLDIDLVHVYGWIILSQMTWQDGLLRLVFMSTNEQMDDSSSCQCIHEHVWLYFYLRDLYCLPGQCMVYCLWSSWGRGLLGNPVNTYDAHLFVDEWSYEWQVHLYFTRGWDILFKESLGHDGFHTRQVWAPRDHQSG